MAKYIIRLDDACPTMNHVNWNRIELLLDKYGVKPIVGVIPDNTDEDFSWEYDDGFWGRICEWQKKGLELSVHGLHHNLHYHEAKGYFQHSHSVNTEFAGIDYDIQFDMINTGREILNNHGIYTRSFFAPAHTFDFNTVQAVKKLDFAFISDGYALKPYQKKGMTFIPSICDGPFNMRYGTYTYVFHPSMMKDKHFQRLELFLKNNRENMITVDNALLDIRKNQGIIGNVIEYMIYVARAIRRIV